MHKEQGRKRVKYLKLNALIELSFASWHQLNDYLVTWAATIVDQRIHGTTKERPAERSGR
jgi:transposase